LKWVAVRRFRLLNPDIQAAIRAGGKAQPCGRGAERPARRVERTMVASPSVEGGQSGRSSGLANTSGRIL
jgi:hypothetical protein